MQANPAGQHHKPGFRLKDGALCDVLVCKAKYSMARTACFVASIKRVKLSVHIHTLLQSVAINRTSSRRSGTHLHMLLDRRRRRRRCWLLAPHNAAPTGCRQHTAAAVQHSPKIEGSGRGCCPERAPSSHKVMCLQSPDAAAYARARERQSSPSRRQAARCRWAVRWAVKAPRAVRCRCFPHYPASVSPRLPLTRRGHPVWINADASCTQAGNSETCQWCRCLRGCWQQWHSSCKQHLWRWWARQARQAARQPDMRIKRRLRLQLGTCWVGKCVGQRQVQHFSWGQAGSIQDSGRAPCRVKAPT